MPIQIPPISHGKDPGEILLKEVIDCLKEDLKIDRLEFS
jgi:hypothetical protein